MRRSAAALTAGLLAVPAGWWFGTPAPAQPLSPASVSLSPPCPLDPSATPDGSAPAVTVTGLDFTPFADVLVTFDADPGGEPETVAAATDGFGRFTAGLHPGPRPLGNHTVRADDLRGREATATFLVACHPTVELVPPVGPPGSVVQAVGSKFPPNAAVRLSWAPGLTETRPPPVVADANGAFQVPVLVFPKDITGPRRLHVEPAGPIPFGATDAPFLVARRSFLFDGEDEQ